jgi:hypothetical protein
VYHLWDDKPFTELSPNDMVEHFQVNVVVSPCFLSLLKFAVTNCPA